MIRKELFKIIDGGRKGGKSSRIFAFFIITLVTANLLSIILETDAVFKAEYGNWLRFIQVFTVIIFALEYVIRVWSCVDSPQNHYKKAYKARFEYMFSPAGVVDLVSALPFFMSGFSHMHFLQAVRMFKVLRYFSAVHTLVEAVRVQQKVLGSAGLMMLVLLIFMSFVMYYLEHDSQPEAFGTMADSLWWGVVTLTTLGYGDVVPVTAWGKVFGAITTMLGFGMFALPAGILASAFAQEAKKRNFVVSWNLVAQVPVLNQLNAADIAEVASLLKPRHVVSGEAIVRKGEPADCVYFIVDGEVKVNVEPNPVFLKDGNFFGEIALLKDSMRTADVVATRGTQLLMLPAKDFKRMLEDHPNLQRIMREVARRRTDKVDEHIREAFGFDENVEEEHKAETENNDEKDVGKEDEK